MLRMALVRGQSMNRCCRTFETYFCRTFAGARFSFLRLSGGCDHYDYALRGASRLCRDLDLLLLFFLLAVKPLPLELAI